MDPNKKYLKDDYWELVKPLIDDDTKYRAEEIMKKYGVKCLRLPPFHPELNFIGKITFYLTTLLSIS